MDRINALFDNSFPKNTFLARIRNGMLQKTESGARAFEKNHFNLQFLEKFLYRRGAKSAEEDFFGHEIARKSRNFSFSPFHLFTRASAPISICPFNQRISALPRPRHQAGPSPFPLFPSYPFNPRVSAFPRPSGPLPLPPLTMNTIVKKTGQRTFC